MSKLLGWIYPLGISVFLVFLLKLIGFDNSAHNFDKVLDAAVTFSSIVVGFLAALLGILVSIRNADIVKAIFEEKEHVTLKHYFNETFILGFLVIIFSSILYVLINEETNLVKVVFFGWNTFTFWFVISTYRIVSILMTVFFKSNDTNKRPESNTVEDNEKREELKRNLSKEKQ